LHVSAIECTASENKEAEPVNNQPIVLTTAFVALLDDRKNKLIFLRENSMKSYISTAAMTTFPLLVVRIFFLT
jgi:hypothetical protein